MELLILVHNKVMIAKKKLAGDKHSSLYVRNIRDKEKKFNGIYATDFTQSPSSSPSTPSVRRDMFTALSLAVL